MDRLIGEHGGRIVNTAGDSVLAEFPSVVDAVQSAAEAQKALAKANQVLPDDRQVRFRVGIHVGELMVKGGDLFGDGVNIAARLQALAEPGEVCLSDEAHHQVRKAVPFGFTDLGPQPAKNIEGGVRAFAIRLNEPSGFGAKIDKAPVPWDRPSVAVLPFENLSGQPDDTYFSDGISDEIITSLARFRTLLVIARNSSFAFRDRSIDLAEIGRRLGVTYLVQGSVRRGGDRIRVSAQLVEARTGAHLWAERYDRRLDDLLTVQDEVAQTIAATLFGRIEDATLQKALRQQTGNPAAYDLALRSLVYFRGYGEDDNRQACKMFERAVALDPQYALAHAYLAFVRIALDGYASASSVVLEESFKRAAHAVDLDPQDSRCHRMLAVICLYRREHDTAEHHFRRALDTNPNDADATQQMGYLLALRGRSEEALQWMAASRRLNPYHPTWYNHSHGIALYSLGRFAEAAQVFKRLPNPGPWLRARLAACYAQQGDETETQAQVTALLRLRPNFFTEFFLRNGVLLESVKDRELLREGLRKAGLPE